MKKLLVSCTTLMVLLFGVNTSNAMFLENWYLDIDGAGTILSKELISEHLDIVGPAYIKNTFTSLTEFTFTEEAVFNSTAHDGGTPFSLSYLTFPGGVPTIESYELTGFFTGSGVGTLGGSLSFTSGTLDIYSDATADYGTTTGFFGADNGVNIASFSLLNGTGTVDPNGVPNGQITVVLEATSMAAGYFFDDAMVDLSLTDPIQWVLGFSTTNASYVANPSVIEKSEFGIGANTPPFDLFVSSNGQYRLAVVPEPSTFLLLGGGLVGLGILGYRRKNQK